MSSRQVTTTETYTVHDCDLCGKQQDYPDACEICGREFCPDCGGRCLMPRQVSTTLIPFDLDVCKPCQAVTVGPTGPLCVNLLRARMESCQRHVEELLARWKEAARETKP